jgi:hypothetical protein
MVYIYTEDGLKTTDTKQAKDQPIQKTGKSRQAPGLCIAQAALPR